MENTDGDDANKGASSSKTNANDERNDDEEKMDEDEDEDKRDNSSYTASSTSVYSRHSRPKGDVAMLAGSKGGRIPDRKKNVRNGRVEKRKDGRRKSSKHTRRVSRKRAHHHHHHHHHDRSRHGHDRGRDRGRDEDHSGDRGRDENRGNDRGRDENRGKDRGRDENRGKDRGRDENRGKDRSRDKDRGKDQPQEENVRKDQKQEENRVRSEGQERSVSPRSDLSTEERHEKGSRCKYCGHHCCRRRRSNRTRETNNTKIISKHMKKMRDEESRENKKHLETRPGNAKDKRNDKENTEKCSEAIQAGSASLILSPLLIRTDATLNDDSDDPPSDSDQKIENLQITPEIIYDSMQDLAKWRQWVPLPQILSYIKKNYPVNPNDEELTEELAFKLYVATIAGILEETKSHDVKYWCLKSDLDQRGLTKTEVTIFWEIYSDTMSPVNRREPNQLYSAQSNLMLGPPTRNSSRTSQVRNEFRPAYHNYETQGIFNTRQITNQRREFLKDMKDLFVLRHVDSLEILRRKRRKNKSKSQSLL